MNLLSNKHAGRNDTCPCGSEIKYKHCYMVKNNKCALFLKEKREHLLMEHHNKEKEVFRFFNDSIEDIGSVFKQDNKTKKDFIAQRVQLITVFTFLDIMANYWFEYLGRMDGTPSLRFEVWYKTFCSVLANKEYVDDFQKLSTEKLYSLRNSMVHFFGLGDSTSLNTLVIIPNTAIKNEIDNWRTKFSELKSSKLELVFIKPKQFHSLVTEGAILMLGSMDKNIKASATEENKKWLHVEGIERIHQKIMKEGAVKVLLENTFTKIS